VEKVTGGRAGAPRERALSGITQAQFAPKFSLTVPLPRAPQGAGEQVTNSTQHGEPQGHELHIKKKEHRNCPLRGAKIAA
jgi:hypothetical protein